MAAEIRALGGGRLDDALQRLREVLDDQGTSGICLTAWIDGEAKSWTFGGVTRASLAFCAARLTQFALSDDPSWED